MYACNPVVHWKTHILKITDTNIGDIGVICRAQLISRRKMSNVTAVFDKKCQISRKAICCSLNPQNHLHALIHKAYLRYLKAINVKNVTNGQFTVHWYADSLPGSTFTCSIICSVGKLMMMILLVWAGSQSAGFVTKKVQCKLQKERKVIQKCPTTAANSAQRQSVSKYNLQTINYKLLMATV